MAAKIGRRIKKISILEDYNVDWNQRLGTGISGPVRPCTSKVTGERYAVKCLMDNPKSRNEVNLHMRCRGHPNVVTVYDVYANNVQFPGESSPKVRLLMVLELMDGGELFDRISQKRCFTEREASQVTKQIALAIQQCHSLNIAHRDIKPENLLLKDNSEDTVVKLSDFGFAKIDDGNLMSPQYTPYYVSPQVLEAQIRQAAGRQNISKFKPYTYDKSCDMWSLGVIVYIMLCGYPPFYSETPNKPITPTMKRRILAGQYDFPDKEWSRISADAKHVVKRLLHVDPAQRLSVDELLQQPWLQDSAPDTILPSPSMLLDKDNLEEIKLAHLQQLTNMRTQDISITLKPVKESNNPIFKKRQHSKSDYPDSYPYDEPPSKQSSTDMAIQKMRDIIAHCILPPQDSKEDDEILNDLVIKACEHNMDYHTLHNSLKELGWNGSQFNGKVDRNKLAHILSETIEHKLKQLKHC